MAFRPDAPTAAQQGRVRFSDPVGDLFRRIMPGPFRLKNFATADLPTASEYKQGLVYDDDDDAAKLSDGSNWTALSMDGHTHTAANITDFNEAAQDAVGGALTDSGTIDFTYTDASNTITAAVKADSITYSLMQNVSATDKLLGRSTAGSGDVEEIACTSAGRALLDDASASAQRTTLGLGTAAVKDTGTSGNTVPLLDGTNTWSGLQLFDLSIQVRGTTPSLSLIDTNETTSASEGNIRFRDQDGTEEARIEKISGSSLLRLSVLGTTALDMTSSAVLPISSTTASAANVFQNSSGSALLRSTSSERYKTAITDLPAAQADKVLQLRPIAFRSTAAADDANRTHWGLIAEEVHSVLPVLVNYDAEGLPDGVQYDRIIPGLLSVVKRLEARVRNLEAGRPRT